MEGASSLFALNQVSARSQWLLQLIQAHLLARIFLLLRLRRRTRFFLHLSLIFVLHAG